MRFDVCAHSYDEHAGPQRFFAERVAQFILGSGSGTGVAPVLCGARNADTQLDRQDACPTTILELGAGTGALTKLLAGASGMASASLTPEAADSETGAPILATDASPTMVERGRASVPQAQWSVLDAFKEPLPAASLQISSGLLHWASDPVATLARWKQFLAPGGRMIHAVPVEPCLTEWRALVPDSPVVWRIEQAWFRIFANAGLHVRRQRIWIHRPVYPSSLELLRSLHHTGVTGRVRVGPARLRQALRLYNERHRVPGGVKATWTWLAVEATHGM